MLIQVVILNMIKFQYTYFVDGRVIELYEITSTGWYYYSRNSSNTVTISPNNSEGLYLAEDAFYISEPSDVEFKDGILESIKPKKENSCKHEWKEYIELNYRDEYCVTCGNKK